MKPINENAYLREMSTLLEKAARKWRAKKRPPEIFAISIWTDPQACASALNIETRRNSDRFVKRHIAWAKKERASWIREGDRKMADLFLIDLQMTRNGSPSDFEFRMLAEVKHRSFDCEWGQTAGAFRKLVPLLIRVRNDAAKAFGVFPVDPEAEVRINTARDWYARPVRLKAADRPGRTSGARQSAARGRPARAV
jgi:hypothetical protein